MMNKQTSIAYIDLLTVLMAFFVLTTGLLMVVNQQQAKGHVEEKAEYMVVLEWDDKSLSDVDLWIRNPAGDIMSFQTKDSGLMTLDRDDLGASGNRILVDGKIIEDPTRREIGSIRGIIPGQFVVNVMLYNYRNNAEQAAPTEVPVKVQIIRINPYREIINRGLTLTTKGEEQTVASFVVSGDGSVSEVKTDSIPFAKVQPAQSTTSIPGLGQ